MPDFRRFLSRRWLLAVFGGAALLFGLAMLHPYPRQSLFGPTIRGKPWCYWDGEVRHHAARAARKPNWESKIIEWLGWERERWLDRRLFDDEEMLPLLLEHTKDRDPDIRATAISAITYYKNLWQEPALPVLREQLHSNEPVDRIYAAQAVWHISRDKTVITILFQILREEKKEYHRSDALRAIAEIGSDLPELFSDVAAIANGSDESLRPTAVSGMRYFGMKGLPIIEKSLYDPDESIRSAGANAAGSLGTDALCLAPRLEELLNDRSSSVRGATADALRMVDRQRYDRWYCDQLIKYGPEWQGPR